jgi:hypothetical protein
VVVRAAGPEDEPALLASFARAFAQIDPGAPTRSPAEWRWRTREHPWGARSILALDGNERVLAHFGGWPQHVQWGNERLPVSLAIDTFVDPAVRSGSRRAALLEKAVAAYVERWCGALDERDRLAWGLPIDRAWRLGRARLSYGRIDALWLLVRDGRQARKPRTTALEVGEARSFPAEIEALCESVSRSDGARFLRDRAWLEWRWLHRPLAPYRLLVAHGRGILRGACVWRVGSLEDVRGLVICDWLVPPEDHECALALLDGLPELAGAARDGAALPLVASFTPRSREFASFQARGFRVRPARHFLAGRSFDPRHPLEEWGSALELSVGDTDLA